MKTYEYIGPKASRSSRSCGREWESLCCRSTGGIDRCELQVKYKTLTSSRQNERYSASMSKYGIKNLKIIFNIFKWLLNRRLSKSLLEHLYRKFWSQEDDLKNTCSRSQYLILFFTLLYMENKWTIKCIFTEENLKLVSSKKGHKLPQFFVKFEI